MSLDFLLLHFPELTFWELGQQEECPMNLDKVYPYVTTEKRKCDHCDGSLKLVKYHDHDFGKVYCSSTCYANGVAQDIQFLEESNFEDDEADICECKRCKPPPED